MSLPSLRAETAPTRASWPARPVLLAVLLLLLAGCGGGASSEPTAEASGPKVFETVRAGDPVPQAQLERLGDEGTVDTAAWVGTPTVVNFWATWCAFCIDEMPDLEQVHQELAGQVRFVGIDREDPNAEEALELARETGVTYELLRDPDGSYFRAMKGRGMPLTVLVDEHGSIQYRHNGPLTADQLRDLIDEHLSSVGA